MSNIFTDKNRHLNGVRVMKFKSAEERISAYVPFSRSFSPQTNGAARYINRVRVQTWFGEIGDDPNPGFYAMDTRIVVLESRHCAGTHLTQNKLQRNGTGAEEFYKETDPRGNSSFREKQERLK